MGDNLVSSENHSMAGKKVKNIQDGLKSIKGNMKQGGITNVARSNRNSSNVGTNS